MKNFIIQIYFATSFLLPTLTWSHETQWSQRFDEVCSSLLSRTGWSAPTGDHLDYLRNEAVSLFKERFREKFFHINRIVRARILQAIEQTKNTPEEIEFEFFGHLEKMYPRQQASYDLKNRRIEATMNSERGKLGLLLALNHELDHLHYDQVPQRNFHWLATLLRIRRIQQLFWLMDPRIRSNVFEIRAYGEDWDFVRELKQKERNPGDLLRLALQDAGVPEKYIDSVYREVQNNMTAGLEYLDGDSLDEEVDGLVQSLNYDPYFMKAYLTLVFDKDTFIAIRFRNGGVPAHIQIMSIAQTGLFYLTTSAALASGGLWILLSQ